MEPKNALAILEEASGKAQLVREDHVKVLTAIQVLRALVEPLEKKDKPEDKA